MEQHKLLDSLRTLVKRLNELSPELNLLDASVLNSPGLPINQWQDKLGIFIRVIDERINEKTPDSDWAVWVAKVKALAADVEEILNEIAGTQTSEEPSKNCVPFFRRRKKKAVHTVNDGMRTKIFHTGTEMATLNMARSEIGLQVSEFGPLSDIVALSGKIDRLPPEESLLRRVCFSLFSFRMNNLHLRNKNNLPRHKNLVQGQLANTIGFMSEPLSGTGTRRIKTDSNPEIHDSEDDIEIS